MFTQITASAGAGKTYTLTHLFLDHLKAASFVSRPGGCTLSLPAGQYGLPEILAATFTNKAASEMKDRVILALKEKALSADEENLTGHYERWLQAIFKQASLLNIRTIDSLLFLLVRLSALDLHLPPETTPSFSNEEYYTPLYDAFMSDIAAYANGASFHDDPAAPARYDLFLQALEEYYRALVTYTNHDGFSLKTKLHDDIFRLVQRLLVGEKVPVITSTALHATINGFHKELLASCETMLDFIEKENLTVHKDLLKSIARAQASSPYDVMANNKITQPGYKNPSEIVTKKSLHTPSEHAQKVYEKLCLDYERFTAKIPVLLGALPLVPLIPLAKELFVRVHENIFHSNLLPAELIPGLATNVLSGEYGVSDALCRMGNRLHHILLDEFQDTSVEQWQAIEPLVVECLSKGGSFTYVGDVKQAIYSWRKGEIRLFNDILQTAHQLHRKPSRKTLDKNWRSSPDLIRFNNAFFSLLKEHAVAQRVLEAMLPAGTPDEIMLETRNRLLGIYENVEQNLPPKKQRPQYTHNGAVYLYSIQGRTSQQLNERIQLKLVSLIPTLLERWKFEDIAILTRSGEESSNVAAWLANERIPVITENSFMLADNPLISRLVSLLAFVDYPYDDLAFWEFLTGEECFGKASGLSRRELDLWLAQKREDKAFAKTPIFQLFRKDYPELWEQWIAPFHNRSGLMSAYDMLHESIRVFQLFTHHPTDGPFLTRLLELAHHAETQGISSLAGFLQFWEKARENEKLPSPQHMSAIKVMTMHKAKGLEFPVVILPFQHGGSGLDKSLTVDESLGFPLLTRLSKHTPVAFYDKEATNAIECLNLLYVAWTRPKYELHSFITSHSRPAMLGKGLQVLLEEFLELPFAGYTYEECVFDDEPYDQSSDDAAVLPKVCSAPDTSEGDAQTPEGSAVGNTKDTPPDGAKKEQFPSSSPRLPATSKQAERIVSQQPTVAQGQYLMHWLPDLKIFRTNLENFTFTPTQRGNLFHLCLEHLRHDTQPNSLEQTIANAISLGLQKFPFVLPQHESLTNDITHSLRWFLGLPQTADWLKNGLREQSLLADDNQLYRVDLLVPEGDSFRAVDYKTGTMAGHEANVQQVKNYLSLLSRVTGKAAYGTLVYLDLQQLVEVS